MEYLQVESTATKQASLGYLFGTFLKIGSVSFGGYMSLVSLVQKIMVEKDETIDNDLVIDSIAIASLIPGPLAVNVVANIGYHLKGKAGAFISMFAVLLPACVLMLLLAWSYFSYAYRFDWSAVMYYVVGVVSALILSTGLNLYKKEIGRNYTKALPCLLVIVVTILMSNYASTICLILIGALAGVFTGRDNLKLNIGKKQNGVKWNALYASVLGLLSINEVVFLSNAYKLYSSPILKLVTVFSGISLTLFGGGYVMIPIMQSLFVNSLHWLTDQQFVDAIAFSQATPGPILVSATFIGYKFGGVIGAVLATIAMFAPSAILMILVSKFFKKNKEHSLIKDMVSGIKVVVIGLIIASAVRILLQQPFSISLIIAALVALALNFKYKVNPVYLIISSIFLGIIKQYLI